MTHRPFKNGFVPIFAAVLGLHVAAGAAVLAYTPPEKPEMLAAVVASMAPMPTTVPVSVQEADPQENAAEVPTETAEVTPTETETAEVEPQTAEPVLPPAAQEEAKDQVVMTTQPDAAPVESAPPPVADVTPLEEPPEQKPVRERPKPKPKPRVEKPKKPDPKPKREVVRREPRHPVSDQRRTARTAPAGGGATAQRGGSGIGSGRRNDPGYASKVRAILAGRIGSLSAGSTSGTAMIAFSVSAGGGVASARISRSSGDPSFDRAALSRVRGARLPPPPAGRFSAVIPVRSGR